MTTVLPKQHFKIYNFTDVPLTALQVNLSCMLLKESASETCTNSLNLVTFTFCFSHFHFPLLFPVAM